MQWNLPITVTYKPKFVTVIERWLLYRVTSMRKFHCTPSLTLREQHQILSVGFSSVTKALHSGDCYTHNGHMHIGCHVYILCVFPCRIFLASHGNLHVHLYMDYCVPNYMCVKHHRSFC